MTVERIISNGFILWGDSDSYIITATKKRIRVFKGTLEEAEDFISSHPYGMTVKEAEEAKI